MRSESASSYHQPFPLRPWHLLGAFLCYPRVMSTRKPRPVTFVCEWCGEEKTEDRAPGPLPRYCAEHKAEAQ